MANVPFHKRLTHLAGRRDENGRRRPEHLKPWETRDILVLTRNGYTVPEVAKLVERDEGTVTRVLAYARDFERRKLVKDAKEAFKVAMRVAAENGDHKPALEWLDRYGAIPETSRQRTQLQAANIAASAQRDVTRHLARTANGIQPTVNIGFGLPAQLQDGDSQSVQISVTSGDSTALNNPVRTDIQHASEPRLLRAVGTLEG